MLHNEQDAPSKTDTETLVFSLYKAFATKDLAALDAIVSDDWLDVPMLPGQLPGRAGLAEVISGFHKTFSDISIEVEQLVIENEVVAAKILISGKQIAPFLGVSPTEKRAFFAAHELHLIKDGRIVQTDHIEDFFGFLQRAGALPH